MFAEIANFEDEINAFEPSSFITETITSLEKLKNGAKNQSIRCKMELLVTYLQEKIVSKLQSYEEKVSFQVDRWMREEAGGGISCVLQDGMFNYSRKIWFYLLMLSNIQGLSLIHI